MRKRANEKIGSYFLPPSVHKRTRNLCAVQCLLVGKMMMGGDFSFK
jgi:hypothetical protein